MDDNYWHSVVSQRLNRRRALAASGAFAAGAAFLAACGGGSDSSGSKEAASSIISPVTDDTKSLKRGGVIKSSQPVPLSLDPHLGTAGVVHIWHNYSPLFKVVEGHLTRATGDMEGEVIDSWELSPDKLTITAKVTKDVAFAPLPPVNGRAVDAQDIAFSWKRYNSVSPRRAELANEATRRRRSSRSRRSTTRRFRSSSKSRFRPSSRSSLAPSPRSTRSCRRRLKHRRPGPAPGERWLRALLRLQRGAVSDDHVQAQPRFQER